MTTPRTIATIKADLGDAILEITHHYPKNRSAIMPALYLAQEKYGVIDGDVYVAISEILDVPEVYVFEVASFYTMYNRKAVGKFHIQVCTNLSCMLLGAYDLLDHMEKQLGIKAGETTPDGQFSLCQVECIGSCDGAPVMMINDVYHNLLTLDRVNDLLGSPAENLREATG